jgi:hypothetical protein
MNRYSTSLQKLQNGNSPKYYKSVVLNSVPSEDIPFYYTTKEGDRLDVLSNMFYKTPDYWWVLAKANNLVNGSFAVHAGITLYIPTL